MKSEIKLITPKMARKLLETNNNNLWLNVATVSKFIDIIKSGQWIATTVTISKNGVLDGQHRLMAIVKANIAVDMRVLESN